MTIPASHTRSILLTFAVSLLFLVMAVITDRGLTRSHSPEKICRRMETVLADQYNLLGTYLEQLRAIEPTNQADNQTALYDLYRLYEKRDMVLLEYHADSLVMWTSSALPMDSSWSPDQFNRRIMFFQNGWYLIRKTTQADRTLVGLYHLKNDYSYQNKYLDNAFSKSLNIPYNILITNKITDYPIHYTDGTYLFSLVFPPTMGLTGSQIYVVFGLYFLFLIFFIAGMYQVYQWFREFLKISTPLLFLAFTLDVAIVRVLILVFQLPHSLYQTDLFKPLYYGSSFLFPSVGDLVVNVLLLLFIAYAFFVMVRPTLKARRIRRVFRYILSIFFFLFIFFLMDGVLYLVRGLILDSNFSLDLSSLFDITFSSILGFGVIACLLICFFMMAYTLFVWIYLYLLSLKQFVLFLVSTLILYYIPASILGYSPDPVIIGFLAVFLISLWVIRDKRIPLPSFSALVYLCFLFAAFSTYFLHSYHQEKEKEQRKWMAIKLSIERDQITEYLFSDTEKRIATDSILRSDIFSAVTTDSVEQRLIRMVEERYLSSYRDTYSYQVTICDQKQVLQIQPENYEAGCIGFFTDMIRQIGKPTAATALYFLDDGTDDINYLARFSFVSPTGADTAGLFIELYSKYIPKALGYPELLIDQKTSVFTDLTNYSYAIYNRHVLTKSVGKFFYPINENELGHSAEEFTFFSKDDYSHLHYTAGPDRDIIVSTQRDTLWSLLSPFAYLILFYGIALLVLLIILNPPMKTRMSTASFKSRLQVAVITIIFVSFLVIGITSLFYLDNLNTKKNMDILSEKTHSVLIELEHKLSTEPSLSTNLTGYLTGLLNKFSQVFFTDINLYDTTGYLLASSRNEIFEEGLQSRQMDPMAFHQMAFQNKTVFIHKERIGSYEYLSAYVPFQNNANKTIAFVNLPYFARQTELRQEISTFLTTFVNINVILIALATFVALIVSSYITRPMELIRDKMRKLKLGRTNEKINWPGKDEIGNLVEEYNRMIDELANSAELLARSERESAWREMAKQVAHEIKNPLTPMKLSIQYLQKAWDEKAPDWDVRLKRFTDTIIQQIDNLSLIANEFSDFAKMPQPVLEKVDLKEVILHAVDLYNDIQHITFITSDMPQELCLVRADRKQMLRVFNNLIKNSVQAIPSRQSGLISVSIHPEESACLVQVKDNGIGIPAEQIPRIFTPSFTTKTGGMGMGLAIVKSIIVNSGGEIWFESREGEGTVFSFRLPLYPEKK